MAAGRWRSSVTASALAILAALLGLAVGLLFGDPTPGVAFGLGLLLGSAGAILVIPALRASPAGVSGAAIDDAADGWAEFHRELARARRFDGQFGIVRFGIEGEPDGDALTDLRNGIAAASRRIDRLWIDDDHVLLLLPETTKAAAEAAVARIRSEVAVAGSLEPSVALFPEHGITSGALISAVYGGGPVDIPTPLGAVRPDLRAPAPAVAVSAESVATIPADDMASQSG